MKSMEKKPLIVQYTRRACSPVLFPILSVSLAKSKNDFSAINVLIKFIANYNFNHNKTKKWKTRKLKKKILNEEMQQHKEKR